MNIWECEITALEDTISVVVEQYPEVEGLVKTLMGTDSYKRMREESNKRKEVFEK